jgi:peptidylprolyl isomerase
VIDMRAAAFLLIAIAPVAAAQAPGRRPLTSEDIDDIARLVMVEDRRELDEPAFTRILRSTHPEVRRRAALAIGRIAKPGGRALLAAARGDSDTAVAATVVFATGQLTDTGAVPWLASLLTEPRTPPTVTREAARAFGRIRTPEARAALARYLAEAPATPATAPVVGEALLSIGRFTTRGDLAPIVRWTTSPDTAVRWRATWALFRPRDPASVQHLLRLSEDPSGDVRHWAIRGLGPAAADSAGIDRQRTSARLRDATRDSDRRVRAEALRALALYEDDASFAVVLAALDSDDSWLSVSAAEAAARFANRADRLVPRLVAAGRSPRSLALRITALTPLTTLAPDSALGLATALSTDSSAVARMAAMQALRRLGAAGTARLDSLRAVPALASLFAPAAPNQPAPPAAQRTEADYRQIVERWVVPAYNGAPKPRSVWETPRGTVEIELHAPDAPMAAEYFVRAVESGQIVGTEFGRVVPNFVAQQRAIRGAVTQRDEVNRLGLTGWNLSWASSGLDTGRPGYTLGSTPQPHNEGGFTAMGRIVRGMDVVDRLELGDRILSTRMVR